MVNTSFCDHDDGVFFVQYFVRCFFVCNISTINHKPVRCGSEVPGKLFIRTKRHSFEIVFNIFLQKCGRTFGLNVNCSYICEAYSFPSKGRDILFSLLQCPRVVVATCENRRVRCNSSGNSSSSLLKANLTDFLRGTVGDDQAPFPFNQFAYCVTSPTNLSLVVAGSGSGSE